MNKKPNAYQLQHSDFSNNVDIVCPKCGRRALVKGPGLSNGQDYTPTVCICVYCGYNQKYADKKADMMISNSGGKVHGCRVTLWGGEVDSFFHHPLWYCTSCQEGNIWAYNREHLEIIAAFISATDRGRSGLPYKNSSIASRLPKWVSAAKNRTAVLKCIQELKAK